MPFGFSLGFGSKSQNQSGSFNTNGTQDSTTHSTVTADNPTWATDGISAATGRVSNLGGSDPYQYVTGANGLQTQAYGNAQGLGSNPAAWNNAFNLTGASADTGDMTQFGHVGPVVVTPDMQLQTPGAQSSNGSQYYDSYFNPYLKDVVNTTMNDFDTNAGQTRAQQSLDLARSGAFGGSGAAITQGQTEGQLARARASTDANIRSTGYTTAMGLGQQDASRQTQVSMANAAQEAARANANANFANASYDANANRFETNKNANAQILSDALTHQLGAGTALGNLTAAQDANSRNNIAAQQGAGDAMRSIDQAQAQAPLDLANWTSNNFSTLPLSLFHGTTTDGTEHDVMNQNGTSNSKGKSSGFNFGFTNSGG